MIELKTGAYQGIEFLYVDMPTQGGHRLIKYRYPGSDRQSIEVQGEMPPSFPFTIWIGHEDYYAERDRLLRVLTNKKTGVLDHPTFGKVENVINGEFTLDETITELGRASISVTFEVDNAEGIPVQSNPLPAQVEAARDSVREQLSADLGGGYSASRGLTGNFSDALDNVTKTLDGINNAANVVTPLRQDVAVFRAKIQRLSTEVGELVEQPTTLADSFDGLLADLDNLYASPGDALAVFRSLFSYGDDDQDIVPTTVGLAERKNNRDLVRANIQCGALAYAYLNAVEVEYATTADLDEVQAQLEAQYLEVRDGQLLGAGTSEELDRLRTSALAVLDRLRVNTSELTTVSVRLQPLSVLVYRLYGSTELTDLIAELNNIKYNAFVEGDITVVNVS